MYIYVYIYTDLHIFIYLFNYLCVYIQTNILYMFIYIFIIYLCILNFIFYTLTFFLVFFGLKYFFFYLCSLSVLFSDSSVVPFVRMYPSFFASLIVDFCRLFLFDKVVLFSILLPAKSPVAFHALLIVVSMLYLLHQFQILVHIIITLDLCFFL